MHKKSVLILILAIISISFVLAQNSSNTSSNSGSSSQDVISKAYQCLQNQVNGKEQSSISLQEAVFGVLALGSNSKLVSVIDGKIVSSNHWQETSNPLKDTAQAMLAYNRLGKNTDQIKAWILSKKQTASDLTWFLEIDIGSHEASQCTLSYRNEQQRTININEDMTLSGNPGSCLTISSGGYWLRISSTCIDANFTISCEKDFTTSTLYQRTGSSTVFVSSASHSASASGSTLESVNSKCLSSSSNACDYEATLWAALALDKAGNSINEYLPYLLALSESNKKFLPGSFLHILTDGQDQYSELVQLQQQNKFWQAPNTPYNKFYDSALALLSLQSKNTIEESNSKAYFETITTPEGCWNNNNIRDTGFLLYAGWPRVVSGGGGGGEAQACESGGYTCTSFLVCGQLGGEQLGSYRCPGTKVCCSKSPVEQSCLEQNGNLCKTTEICTGTEVSSSDGSCCLGTCEEPSQADECSQAGGICDSSCNDDEEEIDKLCSNQGDVCCKAAITETEESSLGVWITILTILIIIAALGIIFRNKLKMFIFKSRNKPGTQGLGSSSPPGPGRPPFPPFRGPIPYPRAQPRIIPQGQPMPQRRPAPINKDKEMEETMAKLKEMSK